MAFATVQTTATSVESSAATTHNITLPSGIVDGDLLIAILSLDGTNANPTWPVGWVELIDLISGNSRLSIAYRDADGMEASTVDVPTSGNRKSCHTSYRIDTHDVANPPEISTGATGASSTPDPDSLTPSGGADDYLWLVVAGNDDEENYTAFPTSYTDGITLDSGSGSFGSTVASARKELNAASENPGVFTLDVSEQWAAATIAIYPGGGGDTDVLTADDLLSAIPTLSSVGIDQIHALTNDDLLSAASILDSATIDQIHGLVADDLLSSIPTLDSATIGQISPLVADDLLAGVPTLDSATLDQIHVLSPDDLLSEIPILDTPTMGQAHVFTSDDLLSGTPTLDSATISQSDILTADDLLSEAPTLDSVVVGQAHVLVSDDIVSDTPILDNVAMGQTHVLTSDDLLSGPPGLDTPAITENIVVLTANGLMIGAPTLDVATMGQLHTLTSDNLISGVPTIGDFVVINQDIDTFFILATVTGPALTGIVSSPELTAVVIGD